MHFVLLTRDLGPLFEGKKVIITDIEPASKEQKVLALATCKIVRLFNSTVDMELQNGARFQLIPVVFGHDSVEGEFNGKRRKIKLA